MICFILITKMHCITITISKSLNTKYLLFRSLFHFFPIFSHFLLDTDRIWFDPYPGMVRLSGGVYSNEGTVEVYCNGAWGRVCNASTDANVICTQLGYTGSPRDTAVLVISFLSLPLPLSLSLS